MEAEYISRSEHEEFCKRIDAENGRQNKRLELLEGNTKQINSLTTSVEKLAQSIQLMCKEQEQQGGTSGIARKPGRRNVEAGDRICTYNPDWSCNRFFL